MKGITAVISLLLLVMITIAMISAVFIFLQRSVSLAADQAQSMAENEASNAQMMFGVEAVEMNKTYVRNMGSSYINSSKMSFYLDGEKIEPYGEVLIDSGAVGTITFNENIVGSHFKATGGIQEYSFSPSAVISYIEPGYEYYANGAICSNGTYVIENDIIKFFISIPRTYQPAVTSNCNGFNSTNDAYAGTPVRIWAKGTNSSVYKKHMTVIDDTLFYSPSATSVSSLSNFTVLENGIEIAFNQQGSIRPAVIYTTGYGKNYVKVELIARNAGSTSQSVRLYWQGDQDPPSYICHYQSGWQNWCTNATERMNMGEKWLAEWSSTYNDVMGYALTQGEVEIYATSHGIRLEETSSTVLQPGESHSFVFYIIADAKIPGNEWYPIENAYNDIISA